MSKNKHNIQMVDLKSQYLKIKPQVDLAIRNLIFLIIIIYVKKMALKDFKTIARIMKG